MGTQLDCCLIGDNSLVMSCGEMLLECQHRIRGIVSPSARVRQWARGHGLPCTDVSGDFAGFLRERPCDYLFSVVSHRLLPAEVLAIARHGAINFHDAPLPKYAGIHATAWAIVRGEHEHGVSWHLMNKLTDAGAVLKTRRLEIEAGETSHSLNLKCYEAAVASFRELIEDLHTGRCVPQAQDLSLRTYFPRHAKPTPACSIAWQASARSIEALVRACDFGPHVNTFGLARFLARARGAQIGAATAHPTSSGQVPGTIVGLDADAIRVAAGDGDLLISELVGHDGQRLPAAVFASQERLVVGERLCTPDPDELRAAEPILESVYRNEARWVKRLESCKPLEVPCRRKSGVRGRDGAEVEAANLRWLPIKLDTTAWADNARVSEPLGTTLLAVCLAFLRRISGESRFCVGVDIGTNPPFLAAVLAPHGPLEVTPDYGRSAGDFVRAAQAALADLRRQGGYFRDICARYPQLREVGAGCFPIVCETVDSLANLQRDQALPAGVEWAIYLEADRPEVLWAYDCRAIDPAQLARLAQQFVRFVAHVATSPTVAVANIPILDQEEQHRILVSWNDTTRPYPSQRCLHELIEEQSVRTPDASACVFRGQTLTYRQLQERASALAGQLRSRGVGSGEYVGVFMGRSLALAVALLGVLKSGAAYVPLDPTHPHGRLRLVMEDAGLSRIVTDPQHLDALASWGAELFVSSGSGGESWHRIPAGPESVSAPGSTAARLPGPEDVAYMLYTSGSTGKPKGVPIRHGSVVNLFTSMRSEPGIGPNDRILALTTISFDIACVELFLPLTCGASLEILPTEVTADGRELRRVLEETDVTVVQATPATWRMLLASGWNTRKPMRIWCGGEALVPQLARSLLERCEALWNCYGPTEATIYACFYKVTEPDSVAIGRPVANTRAYILDRDFNVLPAGVAGELYLAGAGLSPGYHARAELTAASFVPDPFACENVSSRLYRTGDCCRYRADGQIEYLGRLDNQVKIRGFRIELGEIEAVLAWHPGVREAVVEALDDGEGNRRLTAYIVPVDADATPLEETLRALLQEHVPAYMIPSEFLYLQQMPVSPNGKVDRKALPQAPRLRRRETAHPDTVSTDEQRVLKLWQEILRRPDIRLEDNFFEIGGDSILLVQLARELSQEYGREFSNVELFRFPTVASFARHIAGLSTSREHSRSATHERHERRSGIRLQRLKRKKERSA